MQPVSDGLLHTSPLAGAEMMGDDTGDAAFFALRREAHGGYVGCFALGDAPDECYPRYAGRRRSIFGGRLVEER